jgi:hypothetical protein
MWWGSGPISRNALESPWKAWAKKAGGDRARSAAV